MAAEQNPNLTWRENVAMVLAPGSLPEGKAALVRLENAGYRVLDELAVPQIDALEATQQILSSSRQNLVAVSGHAANQSSTAVELLGHLLNLACSVLSIDRDALAASTEGEG